MLETGKRIYKFKFFLPRSELVVGEAKKHALGVAHKCKNRLSMASLGEMLALSKVWVCCTERRLWTTWGLVLSWE